MPKAEICRDGIVVKEYPSIPNGVIGKENNGGPIIELISGNVALFQDMPEIPVIPVRLVKGNGSVYLGNGTDLKIISDNEGGDYYAKNRGT
jgi:hypothetical protein